jgi:hypothetical protein
VGYGFNSLERLPINIRIDSTSKLMNTIISKVTSQQEDLLDIRNVITIDAFSAMQLFDHVLAKNIT